MSKSTMNEDIKKYPIFILKNGELVRTYKIKSTNDYNHYTHNLHHYIPKQQNYEKNKGWYEERGIGQKLILLPIPTHEQVHNQAVHNLSDDDFYGYYKISRWELVFNRRYSKY